MRETASIYRVFDAEDNLLYVGMSGSVLGRLEKHIRGQRWAREIATIRVEHFSSRSDAAKAEKRAIGSEAPRYNAQHRPKRQEYTAVRRPESPPTEHGLEVADVCRELKVHENTVRRYISRGILRATWSGGYRISREDLERFTREAAQRKLNTGRIG